jgi:hypothetical protein
VAVAAATGCAWTTTNNAPSWITVTSGAAGTGTGNVIFNVAANTGAARSGTLTIGGQTFTVSQAALVCIYSLSPTSNLTVPKAGGSFSVALTTGSGCAWTVTAIPTWIHFTSTSGTGAMPLLPYTVDNNSTGSSRTATLNIGGQLFIVIQGII